VPSEEGADPREGLKVHLKAGLPDYMVPAQWVLLQAMPLSPNGKLDRKALPLPDTSLLQSLYVAPQSELQQQLAAIWADVLKIDRVGLNDDFFELGGHSLLVMQVIVRVRGQLAREIAMGELFEHSRLEAFAERVAAGSRQGNQVQDELAKSLEALKRLSMEEIDELTS
jgi:acyl carrier protein